jgi:Transglycosylase SLT domain
LVLFSPLDVQKTDEFQSIQIYFPNMKKNQASDEVHMSQFRPLSSVQKTQSRVLTEEQSVSITPSINSTRSLPLFSAQKVPSTGQLRTISDSIPVAPVIAGQFQVLPCGLPVTSTTGRILRIPGARKRHVPTTDTLPLTRHRMSSRLRHGIILFAIFFIGIITLLSLAPLDNGQSALPIVNGITNWVRAEQSSWQFQAHLDAESTATASTSTNTQSVAAPPPMSLPKSVYIAIAQQDAIDAGISPDYFVRQINQESGFNPNAVSPAGAVGIAQFLPSTAAGLGINPWDPKQALSGAAQFMAGYARNYGGDYAKALAAYNAGSGTVQYAVNACGAANWMNCLPGETRNYISVIMGI